MASGSGLSHLDIMRIVNRYIGVSCGYLGDFSYRTHADFYSDYCGLDINPNELQGTTRERFIEILRSAGPVQQARIIHGVIERFPVGERGAPDSRTDALREELLTLARRLESQVVSNANPKITSELVQRALADAEALMGSQGATSSIDRVHTVIHGYLKAACQQAQISFPPNANVTTLLQQLREKHPALRAVGPRDQNVVQILRGLAQIVDATQAIRNNASVAHPNDQLLDEAESILLINACRTLLHYMDTKLTATTV
jgi:hypothetical protein